MRDEDFAYFISKFGEATSRVDVPSDDIEKWRKHLPGQLLRYWNDEGWCGYANGLFWTVDPDDYEDIVDEWLADTPLEQLDSFHVIARSAFGNLYLWGEKTGDCVIIASNINSIIFLNSNLKNEMDDPDFDARVFFSNKSPAQCDIKDEDGEPLFERALSSQTKFIVNAVPKPFIKESTSLSNSLPFSPAKRRQKYLACFHRISMRFSSGL